MVVDGVTVATLAQQRSGEREALIDALREGVALEDRVTIEDMRREVEAADDAARAAEEALEAAEGKIRIALDALQGDDPGGAMKILRGLI
ncbi:MAG TPA: hypothetical protein PKI99_01985 [Terrimesophilobacter sp.]|nr:hypothetical protein [Terrimesophilobacter sp.]